MTEHYTGSSFDDEHCFKYFSDVFKTFRINLIGLDYYDTSKYGNAIIHFFNEKPLLVNNVK